MNKLKIYLDTSAISHLDAFDTPEKMKDTLLFWEDLKAKKYSVIISALTIIELNRCPEPKKTLLFDYLSQIEYVEEKETKETLDLANQYIEKGVLSQKSRDDCRHIAVATITGCKYIVSWNFKHFVNIKTINKVQAVNKLFGYDEVGIVPPSMMLEGDESE